MAANLHREAVAAHAERGAALAAVAYYDPARFDEISDRFGAPCARYDDVLGRSDVDAVVLTTPSGQHAAQAVKAAEAGKHVLVEKPMALRRDAADRMIRACRQAGVRLGVVFQRRAEPLFQKIHRAVVRENDFGRPTLGSVVLPYHRDEAYYEQATWRGTWAQDGGGVLMNQGIHLVDLLVWYLGDLADVEAQAGTLERSVEVEDTLSAALTFESGAQATITATTTARSGFPHRLALYGTGGGLELEGEAVRRWTPADPAAAGVEPPALQTDGGDAGAGGAPGGIEAKGHARLLADFMAAARENRPPLVDGAEGRRSLDAVLSVYEAAGLPHAGNDAEASGARSG
jgi:predicted dehydrogenase